MSHSLERSAKILYIVSAYARHPGDVITPWLVETIHRLQEAGFEVEVLAPAYLGSVSHVIEGVPVHRFRYAPRRWEKLTHDETAPDRVRRHPWYLALVPGYVLGGTRAAVRLAREGGFDIVHVHWPLPHAIQGLAAKRVAGLPTVLSFHGVELTWARQFPPFRPFLRSVMRRADALTANSEYTAGMMRSIYDRDVHLVPFGATVPNRAVGAPIVRESGLPFELLFVGRLVERKGVHYLLDAVAQLRESYRLTLRIVGDGPWRARLAEQAERLGLENVVRFEGFLSSEKLAQRFEACAAFVLPAVVDAKGDTEGLGVVLVEALAYGRPVVASAAGGIVDVVKDGETGTLVPPGDADALASAIAGYMERPERAQELAAAGRAHVQANFSWPAIIGRLADLYRELLQS
jgi:glycosyltransferase involved in cell wall biosynthesis